MISLEEAQKAVLANIRAAGTEKVELLSSLGRVLAEDVLATRDVPPADNSAMDGYAVRSQDVQGSSIENPVRLRVKYSVLAGSAPPDEIKEGEAAYITTGGIVPPGADAVVIVENTKRMDTYVEIYRPVKKQENIRPAGENLKKGQVVLRRGSLMGPAEIGVLASLGKWSVEVYQRPRVAILSTGSELVEPGEEPDEKKIFNSNSYCLWAMVKSCGGIPVMLRTAPDDEEEIKARLLNAVSSDIIITSAGVSMGEKDIVIKTLEEMGFRQILHKVNIKPGKPFAFGLLKGQKLVFCLPGNPVSVMVTFELFVRPAMLKMMGHSKLFRPHIEAKLTQRLSAKSKRTEFIRVILTKKKGEYFATPTGAQGSGILYSMVLAHGLAEIPAEATEIEEGKKVKVHLLQNFTVPDL